MTPSVAAARKRYVSLRSRRYWRQLRGMMAAEIGYGETQVLVEERQVTRLSESVFREGRISKAALDFLCATLAKVAVPFATLAINPNF